MLENETLDSVGVMASSVSLRVPPDVSDEHPAIRTHEAKREIREPRRRAGVVMEVFDGIAINSARIFGATTYYSSEVVSPQLRLWRQWFGE